MKRLLIVLILLLQCSLVLASSGSPPKPTPTVTTANYVTKQISKKVAGKANEIAEELRNGKRKDQRAALEDFIAWLKEEIGEAYNVGADLPNLVNGAKIVFSAACSHDEKVYRKAWSNFLAITLKYAASIGCAFVEPIFLPPLCFVAGHVTGKYLGDFIGKEIHKTCDRVDIRELGRATEKFIEEFDPYDTDEYEEFIEKLGYK